MSGKAEQKSFTTPDETRSFDYGALDLLQIGGAEIGRLTLQPGWRWSEHVKPLAGTELCEAPHFQYHVQGTLGEVRGLAQFGADRKSTRLNSSHLGISYAVFCLKKKKTTASSTSDQYQDVKSNTQIH